MKVLKKRIFALFFDSFILGVYYEMCRRFLPEWFSYLGSLGYVLLLSPFVLKDLVFRNASIGKKIMGLRIYDINWQKPSFSVLIKRTCIVSVLGFAQFWRALFVNGNYIAIFDMERDKMKTFVIDKKVYKKLREDVENETGKIDNQIMTARYNQYLRDLYIKQ